MGLFLQRNLNLFRFDSFRFGYSVRSIFHQLVKVSPGKLKEHFMAQVCVLPGVRAGVGDISQKKTFLDVLATFSGSFSEEKCIFPRFQRENSPWLTLENHVAKALARNQVEWRPYKGKTPAFFCVHMYSQWARRNKRVRT